MLWKTDKEIKGNYFPKINPTQSSFKSNAVTFGLSDLKMNRQEHLPSLPLTSTEAQWSPKPPEQPQKQVDVAD